MLSTTATRTAPDGTTITPAGRYEVHVSDRSAGLPLFRVEILTTGPVAQLHGDDHRSFATRDTAEHYAAQVVELLTFEQDGIPDARIAEVAAGVNADLDAQQAQDKAAQDALNADIARIMAGSQDTFRPVRNTKTGVFRKPPNAVQQRLIDNARNGVIPVGQGVQPATLRAIHDKVGGRLNYKPGMGARKVIASLTLNAEVTA